MVSISVTYDGDLHCSAQHGPSHCSIHTDAPIDNNGRGECFSPTDLVAAGLATCMATIMGMRAREYGVEIKGTRVEIEKHMSRDKPRRIARLVVHIHPPAGVDELYRSALERAAASCPVSQSLHPDIVIETHFHWI